jgi:NAD(P)-dependent dehydrogenase (short-subunit alcohol dehydrogenase family)
MDYKDKENCLVFVFGSNGFIGKEVVKALQKLDAHVHRIDIQNADSNVDLASFDLEKLLPCVKEGAKIGIINCAGYNQKVEAADIKHNTEWFDLKRWQQCMDINLTFPLKLAKFAQQCMMQKANLVDVIFLGSLYSERSPNNIIYKDQPGMHFKELEYVASKHGLIGLVKSLNALDLDRNIRFNSISPGAVKSDRMSSKFIEAFSNTMGGQANNVDEIALFIVDLLFKNWSLFRGSNIKAFGGALN